MKFIFALIVVVLAAAAIEAIPVSDPWQNAWQDPWQQQQNPWQNPWQNAWQDPWQQQQAWQPKGHQEHYVHAIQVPQQPPIPPLHPEPLHLKVHAHPNKIHYAVPHIPHPHLIGVEDHVPEPDIKIVKHGHGWA